MSCCTFVIIEKEKARYVIGHYSCIKDLLQGKVKPSTFQEMSLLMNEGRLIEYTDTKFCPAVIIDFDRKVLINTLYNWFDDFKQYLNNDWTYEEFKN